MSKDPLPAVADDLASCRWNDPFKGVEEPVLSGVDGMDHGGRNSFSKIQLSIEERSRTVKEKMALKRDLPKSCAENRRRDSFVGDVILGFRDCCPVSSGSHRHRQPTRAPGPPASCLSGALGARLESRSFQSVLGSDPVPKYWSPCYQSSHSNRKLASSVLRGICTVQKLADARGVRVSRDHESESAIIRKSPRGDGP